MALTFPLRENDRHTSRAERQRILADPGFGRYFTDHMARAQYDLENGWTADAVTGLTEYSMHPATAVLHYSQTIFEGLKAYRHSDGRIALFRPERNAARFRASAERLALPPLDEQDFVAAVAALLTADHEWVPNADSENSLYIRPFMFASESFLGVRPSDKAEFCVIASPSGAFFNPGESGISLWVSGKYSRAAPGGTGSAKCGGNYAASLAAQLEAKERDCDQVLYTSGGESPVIDESGTMNIFVVTADGELATPRLGTILDGITRDSVLALASAHDLHPVERDIPLDELVSGCRDNTIREVFAAGTAAVITPITRIAGPNFDVSVGEGKIGDSAARLRRHLVGIQRGTEPDNRGWLSFIDF